MLQLFFIFAVYGDCGTSRSMMSKSAQTMGDAHPAFPADANHLLRIM
jgi:hypothetical protein